MARSHRKNRQLVFTAVDEKALAPRFRGGKGYSLAVLESLGLPTPPFITLSSSAGRAVLETGRFPKRLTAQVHRALAELEENAVRIFGEDGRGRGKSVRSGAEFSMPGMMDTILDVRTNEDLWSAIRSIFLSWNADLAKQYRMLHRIRDDLGTAVNIQVMVYGDRGATGIAYSHNKGTGDKGLCGEFLTCARGPDIVQGVRINQSIKDDMRSWNADIADELDGYVDVLFQHIGKPVEVEFTVEDGKLWLLQWRNAKLELEAKAAIAVRKQWEGDLSHEEAIAELSEDEIRELQQRKVFDTNALQAASVDGRVIASGLPAAFGDVVGVVALSNEEAISMATSGESVVLVRHDTDSNDLPGMDAAMAIVTEMGGEVCHASITGRELHKAAVTGCGPLSLKSGDFVSVCGAKGLVFTGSLPFSEHSHITRTKEVTLFLRWYERYRKEAHRIDFESVNKRVCVNRALNDFYLLESMRVAARNHALSRSIAHTLRTFLDELAGMFACYLAIAVASELRYVWERNMSAIGDKVTRLKELGLKETGDRGDDYILTNLKQYGTQEHVEFFRLAREVFNERSLWWGSIGGVRWAQIAEAGEKYLSGEWTQALFVDRVFNLRHNTSLAFDKHPMVRDMTSVRVLNDQLDAKHQIGDSALLRNRLVSLHAGVRYSLQLLVTQDPITPFSEAVDDLWGQGVTRGLWRNV